MKYLWPLQAWRQVRGNLGVTQGQLDLLPLIIGNIWIRIYRLKTLKYIRFLPSNDIDLLIFIIAEREPLFLGVCRSTLLTLDMLTTPKVKVASHREQVAPGKRVQVIIDRNGLAIKKFKRLIFVNLTLAKQSVKLNNRVFIAK